MKPETQFYRSIRGPLLRELGEPHHSERIETGDTSPGHADWHIRIPTRDLYIETKVVARGRKLPHFTDQQCAWHTRQARAGGHNFILVLHAPTQELLLWHGFDAVRVFDHGIDYSPLLRLPKPWDMAALADTLRTQ